MAWWTRITCGFKEYEFVTWDEGNPGGNLISFYSQESARSFLEHILRDSVNISPIDSLLWNDHLIYHGNPVTMTNQKKIDWLAKKLASGSIKLFELEDYLTSSGIPLGVWDTVNPAAKTKEPVLVDEDEEAALSWIQAKIVDDVTGMPIPRAQLKFKFSDRSEVTLSSGLAGIIKVQDIPAGSCELSCDLKGATLDNTMHFVTVGDSASGKKEAWEEELKGETKGEIFFGTRIAQITARKVKSSDTLESLAKEAGMQASELAEFNWGVKRPDQIEQCMGYFVGCNKRNDDDTGFVFSDTDKPGLIFIPKPWSEKVQTAQAHTIRIKRVGYNLRFNYHINVDDPENQDDTITLQTTSGNWKHVIQVGSLEEVEPDWVELIFPKPPYGMRYDLVQDPKDGNEPYAVFQGVDEKDFYADIDPSKPEEENEDQEEQEAEDEDIWEFE